MAAKAKNECYEFQRGYICALSCIVRGHGTGTEVREALQALGQIDWRRIDAYDRGVLAETIAAIKPAVIKPAVT